MTDSTDISRVLNEDNPLLVKRVYQSGNQVYGLDLDDNLVFLAKVVPDKTKEYQRSASRRTEGGTAVSKRATRTPRVKKSDPTESSQQQTETD